MCLFSHMNITVLTSIFSCQSFVVVNRILRTEDQQMQLKYSTEAFANREQVVLSVETN